MPYKDAETYKQKAAERMRKLRSVTPNVVTPKNEDFVTPKEVTPVTPVNLKDDPEAVPEGHPCFKYHQWVPKPELLPKRKLYCRICNMDQIISTVAYDDLEPVVTVKPKHEHAEAFASIRKGTLPGYEPWTIAE